VIGGLAVAVAVIVVWMSLRARWEHGLTVITPAKSLRGGGPFAGSFSCRECHPGEHAAFTRSGHSQTLHAAGSSQVAGRLDGRSVPDPEFPGVVWSYARRGGRFEAERFTVATGDVERLVLDFVFGSGHHASTFISLSDPGAPRALEHRLTYYPRDDVLDVTPGQRSGQQAAGTTPLGRTLPPRETLKCFGCHTTPVGPTPPTAAGQAPIAETGPLAANVGCESCHGPAQSHVEAARRGRTDLSMPFGLGGWTAASQLGLCGQCHRHPSRFPPDMIRPDDPQLARFQPIGLMQSKCYTRSGGAFTCVNCHDPHSRASSDQHAYEAACLQCHDGVRESEKIVPCPVSPRNGCLSCHMPKVDSGQRVLFTDHWIRVRRPGKPAGDRPEAVP
jgi:hypothetical protein